MQQNTSTEMGKKSICAVQVKYSPSLSNLKDRIRSGQLITSTAITMSEGVHENRKVKYMAGFWSPLAVQLPNKMPNGFLTSDTGI